MPARLFWESRFVPDNGPPSLIPANFFRAVPAFPVSISGMSDAYAQLLDAIIRHLETLQARGVHFAPVTREVLTALNQPREVRAPRARATPSLTSKQGSGIGPSAGGTSARYVAKAAPAAVTAPAVAVPAELPDQASSSVDAPALSPAARAAAFDELRTRVLACVRCPHLVAARQTVVFGTGAQDAELMFVGEAPGAEEDEQGEPFVGRAGQLLTRMIKVMGFERDEVYIANILKCRPDTPGQRTGNRKPTAAEMQTCLPYLHEQLDLIRPRVVVAMGATAVEGLLGKTLGITKLRGHWQTWRGIPLMPTYHPAYLLRNPALSEKRKVWEDMLAVLEKLGRPISERQRTYFLQR